jgi:hypothetical protein
LLNALRREFTAKAKVAAGGAKGKRKKRTDKESGDAAGPVGGPAPAVMAAATGAQKWGLLAPVMDPITSIIGEFGAGILIALVIFTLGMSITRAIFGDSSATRRDRNLLPQEREILNDMWRREEAGLWEWLEDRSRIGEAINSNFEERVGRRYEKEAKKMRENIRVQSGRLDPKMVQRQVDEAIRVTEERLGVLKKLVDEKKYNGKVHDEKVKKKQDCGCKTCGCGAHSEPTVEEILAQAGKGEV